MVRLPMDYFQYGIVLLLVTSDLEQTFPNALITVLSSIQPDSPFTSSAER
jgi:hypothetical protein